MTKFTIFILFLLITTTIHAQQAPIDGVDARSDPAEFAKGLGSTDAMVRQRSAEALAKLAATTESCVGHPLERTELERTERDGGKPLLSHISRH